MIIEAGSWKETDVFQTGLTEFAAQSNGSIHRKVRDERNAQPQKSLNSEEIIRTGTWISRIGRIYTDPGARRLEKAPEQGEAMIVSLPRINKPQMNTDKRRLIALFQCEELKQLIMVKQ